MRKNVIHHKIFHKIVILLCITFILTSCRYDSKIKQSTELGIVPSDTKDSMVKLKMLIIGAEPLDFEDVLIDANKILNKEIGVELIVEFLEKEVLESKYHANFAGGADFDLVQCYPYHYNQYVAKSAYMKLTDDMFSKCAPVTYERLRESIFNEISVDNNIYMVPSSGYLPRQQLLIVRGDLLRQSGIYTIDTIEELEDYFDYIKENVSNMIPLDIGYNAYNLFDFLYAKKGLERYDDSLFMIDKKDDNKVLWLPDNELFIDYFNIISKWSLEEYIPFNASSKKIVNKDKFLEGKSASYLGNIYEIENIKCYVNKKNPQYKPYVVTLGCNLNQVRYPMDNGIAIKNGTTNAAKCLQFIEEINTNKDLFRLLNYGIKGIHYKISKEGNYVPLVMSYRYPIYNNYVWCMNRKLMLPYEFTTEIADKIVINNRHKAIDMKSIDIKLDEIDTLNKNLLYPITLGNIDITENLSVYKKKMEEAGFNLYNREVIRCSDY
ncbi:hypothetical protein SH1V18_40390 [Vallitalea longa]|uniref:Uncharacterized protein n=1 Tax=Vallitalea longa TaxID=2936439 RepID=A0A9W5YEF9_9FIRM|nr:hypothetical protein [Vallitalea longa]GKX31559.1 hypothetical protein SH1V18_40390 [Vallitalea longa]